MQVRLLLVTSSILGLYLTPIEDDAMQEDSRYTERSTVQLIKERACQEKVRLFQLQKKHDSLVAVIS